MPSEAEQLLERLEQEKLRREQDPPPAVFNPASQNLVGQPPRGIDSFAFKAIDAGNVAIESGLREVASNILAAPGVIGDALDAGGAATQAGLGGLTNLLGITDSRDSFGERFGEAFDQRQQLGISTLPRPTAEDILAGVIAGDSGVGNLLQGAHPNFAGEFEEAQAGQQARLAGLLGTTAGKVGSFAGDAATVLTGRIPFKGIARAAQLAPEAVRAQTIVGRAIQATARSSRSVGRRAAQTGAEAATLAALTNEDPVDVGLIASGAQATGDVLARPVFNALKKTRVYGAVIGATLLTIMVKEMTPGGHQIVEQTLKDRSLEVGLAFIISGIGAAATGRVPKSFGGPAFAELAGAIKTTGMVRLISGLRSDPERVGPVAEQFSVDPDYFGPEARKKLERTFSGKANPAAVIGDLMEDETFRQRFEAIGTPAAKTFRQDQLSADVKADNREVPFLRRSKIAGALARRLPKGSSLRDTFENTGPQRFIADFFRDSEAAAKLLPRLGKDTLNKALEINLSQIIRHSRTKGNDLINGERLRQAWSRLPNAVRDAYPAEARKSIEAFIAEAQTTPLSALPPFLAHSLMTDGLLSERLRKEK